MATLITKKPSVAGEIDAWCTKCRMDLNHRIVAMVGDNNHDLHMGRNARTGLTIAVLTGTGSRESLSGAADHVFDDITEIEALLPDLQPA